MPRRIDIELTSARDDGTWTWRAAGAKAPKGTVPSSLLPGEPKVGDVLKVDAEFFVDGIEITGVVPPKGARKEPERLELIVPERRDEPLVTTTLATRSRDDRGPRRDGPRRDGPRRDREQRGERGERSDRGDRPARPAGESGRPPRREGGDRPPRRTRPEPPPMPVVERPKAKRLRAGKAHRSALLDSLPEEQRPIAEQVVLGGLPAVRQAIEKQNTERAAAGEPAITPGPLLEMAEKLVPKVRAAEWRDRAEAAQRDLEHLDLRDLRSVVSTADAAGKDEEARAIAQALRDGLAARVDAEHATWLAELEATVDVGRIVRALRISSRPPKAGAPLPPELSARLVDAAGAALTADAAPERWVAVLDALAFAPVRDKVIPASLPKELHEDVRTTIARLATRIPKIAHIFEITPDRSAPRPKVERRRPPKPKLDKPKQDKAKPDKPKAEKPRSDRAPQEQGKAEDAKAEQPAAAPEAGEAPTTDAPTPDTPTPDTPTTEPAVEAAEAPVATAASPEPALTAEEPEAAPTAAPDAAESMVEGPTVEGPTVEEPAPEEPADAAPERAAPETAPTAEEPTTEAPTTEAPAAAPQVEEPPPEEPTPATAAGGADASPAASSDSDSDDAAT